MGNKKEKNIKIKCKTCEHYDKHEDYCFEKDIEECSKQTKTDFSQCDSYLVNEKLVMF